MSSITFGLWHGMISYVFFPRRKRNNGRPRLCWIDDINENITSSLGLNKWPWTRRLFIPTHRYQMAGFRNWWWWSEADDDCSCIYSLGHDVASSQELLRHDDNPLLRYPLLHHCYATHSSLSFCASVLSAETSLCGAEYLANSHICCNTWTFKGSAAIVVLKVETGVRHIFCTLS